MAKRGTHRHRKIKRLAELLETDRLRAYATMCVLWDYCNEFVRQGDIGRLSNREIAEECLWIHEHMPMPEQNAIADRLVRAMVDAELLDADLPEVEGCNNRLVVHDWWDHAEESTHTWLARKGLYFADGQVPKFSKLNKAERAIAESKYFAVHEGQTQVKSGRKLGKQKTYEGRPLMEVVEAAPPDSGTVRTKSAQGARAVRSTKAINQSQSPCLSQSPSPPFNQEIITSLVTAPTIGFDGSTALNGEGKQVWGLQTGSRLFLGEAAHAEVLELVEGPDGKFGPPTDRRMGLRAAAARNDRRVKPPDHPLLRFALMEKSRTCQMNAMLSLSPRTRSRFDEDERKRRLSEFCLAFVRRHRRMPDTCDIPVELRAEE